MVDRVVAEPETAGAVGHDSASLGFADRLAEIGLARQAVFALAALRRVQRDNVVSRREPRHSGADLDHHAGAFVAQNGGEEALGIQTGQGEGVGMAYPRRFDLNQDFPLSGAFDLDRLDGQGISCLVSDGGANLHGGLPRKRCAVSRGSLGAGRQWVNRATGGRVASRVMCQRAIANALSLDFTKERPHREAGGAGCRSRTRDLLITNQLLYQLS